MGRKDSQWLATMSGGLLCTRAGLYTYMPTLFGFGPKFVIWCSVDAGMDASPVGALVVLVEDPPPGGVDTGVVVVGADDAPGRHCE